MRNLLLVTVACLALTACGGEEYPVAAPEAFTTLSSVGAPSGVSPLPPAFHSVQMDVESVPADSTVRWRFSHEGDDLGMIVAKVDPTGDASSKVTVDYVKGSAPDENWRNKSIRGLIQTAMQPLIIEAIDSRFENRNFDMALRERIADTATVASIGGMMQDASAEMDKAAKRSKELSRELDSEAARNPYAATQPMTDLSDHSR